MLWGGLVGAMGISGVLWGGYWGAVGGLMGAMRRLVGAMGLSGVL